MRYKRTSVKKVMIQEAAECLHVAFKTLR